ncbi:hypothetical protein Noda2021_09470 [Candidatus Dependentiae bacterium Noda2021]|nr:hypothetical protein Noda2021_09470 [Candidatus Dependentiae bacterium Noda2021]
MNTIGAFFVLFATIFSLVGSDSLVQQNLILLKKIPAKDFEVAKILKKLSFYISEQNCSKNYLEQEVNVLTYIEKYCSEYDPARSKRPTTICDHIKKYLDALEYYDQDLIKKKIKKITWHLVEVSKHIDADNTEFITMFLRLFGMQLKNNVSIFELSHKDQHILPYAIKLENSVAVASLLQFNQDLKSLTNVALATMSSEQINGYKSLAPNKEIKKLFDRRYQYRPQFKGHYN